MSITEQNITDKVVSTFAAENPRLAQILESMTYHLHEFVREIEPTEEEWLAGIQFLTEVGQKCTATRQEYILLSDVLGVTALKDAINNRKPEGATEVSVLGPFYREGAQEMALGSSIAHSTDDGELCLVRGRVLNTEGKPITGAILDTWQAASSGLYENQDDQQPNMNLRGRFRSDSAGCYWFKTVKPHYYPIPLDGPAGSMLTALGRHNYRPAHIHFIASALGYEAVTTQIFDSQDPYLNSDAVFGVKDSLVSEFKQVSDPSVADRYGIPLGSWLVEFDFVLNEEG